MYTATNEGAVFTKTDEGWIASLRELYQYRDLLWSWTERTIRARYQQSALGGLWIVVQPMATVAILSIVFTIFLPVETGDIPYPVFSYVAMTPWLFFANSVTDMTDSIVSNMSLITKIYFPRKILPLASMFARVLDWTVSMSVVVVLMVLFKAEMYPLGWLWLPVIFVVQILLVAGLGLIVSAANVYYRDIKSLVALVFQLWFYASPIIYPVSLVPGRFRAVYELNPMVGILESYRAVLLYGSLPGRSLLVSAAQAVVVLIAGYAIFRRAERGFSDVI